MNNRFFALIACAGAGVRAGTSQPKQYQPLLGQPLVAHTLAAFAKVERLSHIFLAVAPDDVLAQSVVAHHAQTQTQTQTQSQTQGVPVTVLRSGGATRFDTVRQSLQALKDYGVRDDDWVLVHDAARCLVLPKDIHALIDACQDDAVGGLLAYPVVDTLKDTLKQPVTQTSQMPFAPDQARAQTTLSREGKWVAQTPQMFRLARLQSALDQALQQGASLTDEASALEAVGAMPLLVAASHPNIKVTYPQDFALAHAVLQARQAGQFPAMRVGEGWDIHQLVDQATTGRKLILGGVEIPFDKGLLGHSDADALCHAMTDALLGAAGLGDIGRHFPDTDARFKGANSLALLQKAAALVRAQGWQIGNIDSTVIAQAPKLAPHIDAMRSSLSQALDVAFEQINIKAKTAEKLGAVGEGRAIEARAVCLLLR